MTRMITQAVLGLLLVWSVPAAAALSDADVKRFVEGLPAAFELNKTFEAEGLDVSLDADVKAGKPVPTTPFTDGLKALREASSDAYGRYAKLVKSQGFASPEAWAETGDRVMLAYIALKTPAEALEMAQSMTPAQLDMLPPNMRSTVESAMAFAKTVRTVPQADRDAVAPYVPQLDAFIDLEGQSYGE
ncbi:MAG: hypothetical protein ACFB6R_06190 [Alphaproteobacteria bacterium]